jgi:hypothetical protein
MRILGASTLRSNEKQAEFARSACSGLEKKILVTAADSAATLATPDDISVTSRTGGGSIRHRM